MSASSGVSVVVVAFYGDRWLSQCMDALAQASRGRLHLLLVDNEGNTGLNELPLDRFDTEVLKTPHRMGFAEANNFALTNASHLEEHVLFLNQDTVSRPRWIDACLETLAGSEKRAAVSPIIRRYDYEGWDSGFADCIRGERVDPDSMPIDLPDAWFRAKNAPATALIVRTDVLRLVGPFDPVFGSYYEDYDLCRRIRDAGFELGFCTSAVIGHFSGSSTTTVSRELLRKRQVLRNRLLYRLRESGDKRRTLLARYLMLELPRNLARGLVGTPSSQPPAITLRAVGDLMRIGDRVVSRRYDEMRWLDYLASIGWPPADAPTAHVAAAAGGRSSTGVRPGGASA